MNIPRAYESNELLQLITNCAHDLKLLCTIGGQSTFCSHILNYDCNLLKVTDIIRNFITATFNILQSHFELWLQNASSWSLGSVVVSVVDSHSCSRGSSPGQGKHIYAMFWIIFSSYQMNLLPSWYYIYVNK